MEDLESQSGAETMPGHFISVYSWIEWKRWEGYTALDKDVQALLHEKRSVEDDQPIAQWEHIVARPSFEKCSHRALFRMIRQSTTIYHILTRAFLFR